MDCQFCSIPWNVVAAVNLSAITSVDRSGRQTNNFVCVLVKNGRSLIVQSEGISFQGQEEYQSLSYEERIRVTNAETALQVERLRLIASIIDTIDFRKYRFAFLDISSPLRLVGYSGKEKLAVPSQVWLRRVPESDLQVVQWTRDRARCVWNGQQVEFFTAFNFSQRRRPEQIIKMLYQFERLGLDITAKPLAFVTREGEIIGIILEKVEGRLVEMRDCTLLHEIFTELHRANIVFASPVTSQNIRIQDNKLRFTRCLSSFTEYKDPEDPEKKRLEGLTWKELEELFKEIPGQDKSLILDFDCDSYRPTLLNYVPSPEHPLTFDFRISLIPYPYIANFLNNLGRIVAPRSENPHNRIPIKPRSRATLLLPDDSWSSDTSRAVTRRGTSYHPYLGPRVVESRGTLPLSDREDRNAYSSKIVLRKRAAPRNRARAVSIESDKTAVEPDDDVTIVGDY